MKHLTKFLLLFIAAVLALNVSAAKKEKTNKEKTPYVWDWDGTRSGDPNFDAYLVGVDELWKSLEAYSNTYEQFTYHQDTITIDGKFYLLAYMQDKAGNMATRSQVNWQVYNSVVSGTAIVVAATNVSLMTANATLALANMGLNAVKFAKYIKGGPMVIAKGMKEMDATTKVNRANAKSWKAMQNAAVDPSSLGCFSEETIKKMKKCCYIKEVVETDPEYQTIVTRTQSKSENEFNAEIASINNNFENAEVLPEDENQKLDDIEDTSELEG